MGSGRTELARAIFGADPSSGEMRIDGKPYKPHSPAAAIRKGVALVTEDRKAQGLFLQLSVRINTTISGLKQLTRLGVINFRKELTLVKRMIQELRIKTPAPSFLVVNMSGGNQQKVVLARWLSVGTRIFIMDEPTRGIDVGSKSEIYQIMDELTRQGVGIIMISSELPEVLGMSDRIMVMRQGRIVKELSRAEASEEDHHAVRSRIRRCVTWLRREALDHGCHHDFQRAGEWRRRDRRSRVAKNLGYEVVDEHTSDRILRQYGLTKFNELYDSAPSLLDLVRWREPRWSSRCTTRSWRRSPSAARS